MKNLTQRIVQKRAERGFVTDPLKIQLLLTEEIGEISHELKREWSPNYDGLDKGKLSDEIADAFVMLVALANAFEIDIEEAVETKFFGLDEDREWRTKKGD